MKITNKKNLPAPMFNFVNNDKQAPKDNVIRVTDLNKGIREIWLYERHYNELEQDVSEMIWLMFGTAFHDVVDQAEEKDHQIKETRLEERIGNLILSGKFDLYDSKRKIVTDYKTCSVWKFKFEDFSDWERQTSIYCWLLRKAGFEVVGAEIVALMKDHSKSKARREADYPDLPTQTIHFPYDDQKHEDTEEFILSRMAEIEQAMQLSDEELPLCTEEERWHSGDRYAVMKNKNKRALRVLDSEEDAEKWMEDNSHKGGTHIVHRPGISRKCIDYCSVCEFCNYYKNEVAE